MYPLWHTCVIRREKYISGLDQGKILSKKCAHHKLWGLLIWKGNILGPRHILTWPCRSQKTAYMGLPFPGASLSKPWNSGGQQTTAFRPWPTAGFCKWTCTGTESSHSLPCNLCLFSRHNVELCSCNGDLMVSIATEVVGPFTEKVCWPP